jgi:hypothetical protein
VKGVLEHPGRKRWHPTPRHRNSWLNIVEGSFQLLTECRTHRGTFDSVSMLIEATEIWAEHWNDDPKPFVYLGPVDNRSSWGLCFDE